MKPKAYKHQAEALRISKDKEAFAFLMEMGTGKTRPTIDTAVHLHKKKKIEAMVVLAPNGVQRNWVLKEVPKWCDVPHRAAWFETSPNRARKATLDSIVARPFSGLRIITANYEQCVNPKFKSYLLKFLKSFKTLIVLDESTRIKTPKAARTKFVVSLRKHSSYRRILSGLVSPNSPFDAYKQFEFLDPAILGFTSFYAFKAHFAEMENNPRFLSAIQQKGASTNGGVFRGTPRIILSPYTGTVTEVSKMKQFVCQGDTVAMIDYKYDVVTPFAGTITGKNFKEGDRIQQGDRIIKIIEAPMLIKRDKETGEPKYRNLDELAKLIAPHSYRALKKDCLDLPEKVYGMLTVELTKKQRQMYDSVREEVTSEFENGSITVNLAIVRLMRLQQITGGFWVPDGSRTPKPIDGSFPKLEAIMDDIEDTNGKVAIWTHFQHENELITSALKDAYGTNSVVQYYGKVSNDKKQLAVDRFSNLVRDKKGVARDEDTGARFWVGEPHSGGIGIECVLAEYIYYYSNSYNLEDRIQSEDRHHRSGFKEARAKWGVPHNVVYKDAEAIDTCDQVIINSLRNKKDIAHVIMGDGKMNWI